MKKNNHWLAVAWILMLSLALSGCQLAKAEAGSPDEDALIGAFITMAPLDLLDPEKYFSDHPDELAGGEITLEHTPGDHKRIYAVLKDLDRTEPEAGGHQDPADPIPTIRNREYVFEGLEGIPLFAPLMPGETREDSYYSTMVSDAVQNTHLNVNIGDQEETIRLNGTIFFEPNRNDVAFHINPVYQSADGRVYLTSGTGMAYAGHAGGEGEIMTKTMDSTVEVSNNGITMKKTHSIQVSLEAVFATKTVWLIEMDKNHRILHEFGPDPGALPRAMDLDPTTEYVIFEDHRHDEAGEWNIRRRILEPRDGSFSVYQPDEYGIMVRRTTILNWPSQTP